MTTPKKPEDKITIVIHGNKKFRQKIVDLVYQALMDEDLQFKATMAGNGFTLESSLSPSEETYY